MTRVLTAFFILLNFHSCYRNLIETRKVFLYLKFSLVYQFYWEIDRNKKVNI